LIIFALIFLNIAFVALITNQRITLELKDNLLIINNKKLIDINNIDWYNEDSNFIIESFTIKTKDGDKFVLSNIGIYNKNTDFKEFKDALLKRNQPEAAINSDIVLNKEFITSVNPIIKNTIQRKESEDFISPKGKKFMNFLSNSKFVFIILICIIFIIKERNIFAIILLSFICLYLIRWALMKRKK
jgi:hypothetical protein